MASQHESEKVVQFWKYNLYQLISNFSSLHWPHSPLQTIIRVEQTSLLPRLSLPQTLTEYNKEKKWKPGRFCYISGSSNILIQFFL